MAFQRIAEAFIELRVRGESLVRGALERVRTEAKKTSDGIDATLGRLGEKLEKQTEGARKLQGAISGIVGIAGALVGVSFALGRTIFSVSEAFRSGTAKAKEFADELRSQNLGDVASQAKAIRDRLQELENIQADIANQDFGAAFEAKLQGGSANLRKEADALREILVSLNIAEKAAATRATERAERAAESLAEQAASAANALRAQQLRIKAAAQDANSIASEQLLLKASEIDANERLLALDRQIGQVRRENRDEFGDAIIAGLERQRALIEENAKLEFDAIQRAAAERRRALDAQRQAELEAAKNVEAERRRLAEETATRIADANAAAFADATRRIGESINAVLSQNNSTFARIEDLLRSVQQTAEQIRRAR